MGIRHDLSAAFQQPEVLGKTAHRPWPLPSGPWVMGQTWERLLFAHWPVDPEVVRRVVHPAIPLDTWEGSAWVGVTPFEVRGLRPRLGLPLPGVSAFPEVNVRTYTTIGGRPGIYFLSLDAGSRLAVHAARRAYRLPYFHAHMGIDAGPRGVHFRARRATGPPAGLDALYRPTGRASAATPGSLEHWLAERYCLYTVDAHGRPLRADIHHPPWPLQAAEAAFAHNAMTAPFSFALDGAPLLHYARRQDVVFWSLGEAA